jgi:hypothetical protein
MCHGFLAMPVDETFRTGRHVGAVLRQHLNVLPVDTSVE